MYTCSASSSELRQAPCAADADRFERELQDEADRFERERDDWKRRFLCHIPTGKFYMRRTGEHWCASLVRRVCGDDGLAWIKANAGYRYRLNHHPLGLVIFSNEPFGSVA